MPADAAVRPAAGAARIAAGAVLMALVAAIAFAVAGGRLLAEAWLFAVVVLSGLGIGSLGLIWIGRLLGRHWLTPLEDELKPAAFTLPFVFLLALPLGLALPDLFDAAPVQENWAPSWLAPQWIGWRSAGYFAIWTLLAWMLVRRGRGTPRSLAGLAALVPTAALAGFDWVLARGPFWWSTLFGFAFALSLLVPALAAAFLANLLQKEHLRHQHDRSLTSALMTLALATLWIWFVQFLAAYMGNLPQEAAWYLARTAEGRWLPLALAAAMILLAILLLTQRHRGRPVLIAASLLLVGQHLLHSLWLLRPLGTPAPGWTDAATLLLLGAAWTLLLSMLMVRQDRIRQRQEAQSGRPGSS